MFSLTRKNPFAKTQPEGNGTAAQPVSDTVTAAAEEANAKAAAFKKLSPRERVLVDPEVRHMIKFAKLCLVRYDTVYLANYESLHAAEAARAIESELSRATETGEIEKLRAKLALIAGPGAEAASAAARRLAREEWKTAALGLKCVLLSAILVLTENLREALKAEREFFSSYGLPVEQTAASRSIEKALAELKGLRSSLDAKPLPLPSNSGRIPNARGSAITWFGVRDIYADLTDEDLKSAGLRRVEESKD